MPEKTLRAILLELVGTAPVLWRDGVFDMPQAIKFVDSALIELYKLLERELPEEVDVRPEITEWLFSKNRDAAEGYNQAIAGMRQRLKKLCEQEEGKWY